LDLYQIIPLIEIVFSLALLTVLIILGRHHNARKPFILFLSFMALWGLFIFLMRSTSDLSQAFFWEKFVFVCILSVVISFFWFTLRFTGTKVSKKTVYPIIGGYVLIIALVPTGLIIQGLQNLWYGKAPVIGPLFFLFVLYSYTSIIVCLLMLLKRFRKSRNTDERTRDQYIIAGIAVTLIGSTSDYLPAIGIGIYPLGIIGNILFCILTTIAMLKYGLLEIRMVLRKGIAYSLISMFIFGVFGSIIVLISTVFQNTINPLSLTITVTTVFLIAAIFQPLLMQLQHLVDRWFFRQRYNYLQDLKQFAKAKDDNLDLSQLTASVATKIANSMQSESVHLLLPSQTNKDFVVFASTGQKSLENVSFPSNAPLAITMKYQVRIVDRSEIEIIPAFRSLPENERRVLRDNNIELLMPLKKDELFVGMLLLGRKFSGAPYTNEDKNLLHSVSSDLAARIDNASRFNHIIQAHNELQRTMEGVISAISAVVETRDPYTAGHQRRVAELARAIAGEMGLSEWQKKGIYIIGLLHDVGKIAVPAEILSKPGKISQFEFSIIKNHSRAGYEILEKVEFPWPVAKAILQHHERLNGSGYPEGLSGDQIILEAKILGVADVVEAMSSHRPYRPALGVESALKEIKLQRGNLYDRSVVEACLNLLQGSQFTFEKLMSAADQPETALSKSC
jgi:putative nucleotidyltransferase with HDIG domain